ncbi:MAG TPA: YfiR family protein [Candidatus Binatia bacterium]|nr:YfiR family protein [Candidatus Binatia bacterium]
MLVLLIFDKFVPPAHAEISKEYQVKAVFLFNFTQFIEWPTNAFPGTNAPLTIGVLGADPFGKFLDATVRGETVNGHPIVVKRFRRAWDVKECQILFVSRSEEQRVKAILASLKDENVLTVSDIEGFAQSGGIIRFVTEDGKIHFRVNLEAAKDAGLMVSAKLLRLAEIVEPGKD